MTQVNAERDVDAVDVHGAVPPLCHQDVEDEVGHLKHVWDRLPECGAADAARRHLELSEEAAHRAVEGGRGATAEARLLG